MPDFLEFLLEPSGTSFIQLYKMLFFRLAIYLLFGIAACFFARRCQKNQIVWSLLGVGIAIALVFPFHDYRITILGPNLKANIASDAIVSTTKISIPGHRKAYNPSIIPYGDGYLLSFRTKYYNAKTFLKKYEKGKRNSYLWLVKLNRDFKPSEKPYLLHLQSNRETYSRSAEDGRLLQAGEKILFFFNDYVEAEDRSLYCPYMAELVEKEGQLQPEKPSIRLHYDKMGSTEKNWSPFIDREKLCLIYSGNPHLILEADMETGLCQKIAATTNKSIWNWGEINGGTPAYLLPEGFLTFFHSHQNSLASSFRGKESGRNYAMGAYLFETDTPFQIKKITPSPLGSLEDYMSQNRRKAVFPSGIVVEGNQIHVVWGKNDTTMYVSSFDREKLLSSMVPCL